MACKKHTFRDNQEMVVSQNWGACHVLIENRHIIHEKYPSGKGPVDLSSNFLSGTPKPELYLCHRTGLPTNGLAKVRKRQRTPEKFQGKTCPASHGPQGPKAIWPGDLGPFQRHCLPNPCPLERGSRRRGMIGIRKGARVGLQPKPKGEVGLS